MEIKTASIIGLGALGILFGHHFSERMAKEDLRIIADGERIERYKREGIYSNGERCNFHYMTPDENCEPAMRNATAKLNYLPEPSTSLVKSTKS